MPLFHTERLEAYAPAMHGALSKLRAKIAAAASRGEPVEVKQLSQQLAIDIIGKAAFGVDVSC
jgi:cytochrome P450